jgi:hypothetical protein
MLRVLVTALCLAIAMPLVPYAASADESRITEADVGRLKPGEFIWKPWLAPDGRMAIMVNLRAQRASVYRDGARIGATTISSGRRKYRTPTGVFRILEKYTMHRSKKYKNAPMPFTERFTRDGVALHGGGVPGYPSSHGCVHLPRRFAQLLFKETSLGTTVVVTNGRPASSPDDHRPLTLAAAAGGNDSPSTVGD